MAAAWLCPNDHRPLRRSRDADTGSTGRLTRPLGDLDFPGGRSLVVFEGAEVFGFADRERNEVQIAAPVMRTRLLAIKQKEH